MKFLKVLALSDAPVINEKAALEKLKALSLITSLPEAEENSRYYSRLRGLQQKSDVLNYTVAPTLNCNCRCPYCFVHKNAISMSDSAADILASHIRSEHIKTGKKVSITWYGGEPLLSAGTIHRISRLLAGNEVPYSADIITNGLLINDDTLKILKDSRVTAGQITLDGYQYDHNKTRNIPTAPYDTYSAAITAASELIAHGFQLKIRINCSSGNLSGVRNMATCPRLSTLDKSKFTIYFEVIDSDPQIHLQLRSLQELFSGAGYNVLSGLSWKSVLCYSCSAMRDSDCCVGPELELYDCYSDLGHNNRVIGVLPQTPPVKSLYNHPGLLPAICKECPALPFCYARGCPYKLAHSNYVHDEIFCAELKARVHDSLLQKLTDKYGH